MAAFPLVREPLDLFSDWIQHMCAGVPLETSNLPEWSNRPEYGYS
jgi:hypothetical protein